MKTKNQAKDARRGLSNCAERDALKSEAHEKQFLLTTGLSEPNQVTCIKLFTCVPQVFCLFSFSSSAATRSRKEHACGGPERVFGKLCKDGPQVVPAAKAKARVG